MSDSVIENKTAASSLEASDKDDKKDSMKFPPEYKDKLIKFGIFTGILIVLLGLLIAFTLLSRNSWKKGLKTQVSQVLNEYEVKYVVGDFVELNSSFNVSCAVFSISPTGKLNEGTEYAVILRTQTLYGPLPGVYIYNIATKNAHFYGFATLHGKALNHIVDNSRNSQISYWERKIPDIVGESIDKSITGVKSDAKK